MSLGALVRSGAPLKPGPLGRGSAQWMGLGGLHVAVGPTLGEDAAVSAERPDHCGRDHGRDPSIPPVGWAEIDESYQ